MICMKLNKIILDCEIDPKNYHIKANAVLTLTNCNENIQLILNPDLQWKNVYIKDEGNWIELQATEKTVPEGSMFKVAKMWEFAFPESLKLAEGEECIIKVNYSGSITQSNWNLSYIREDFVELAIYGLWYPLCVDNGRHSFDLKLTGPKNWKWLANGELISTVPKDSKVISIWRNELTDLDITLLGIPSNLAYENPKGHFWGPKDIVEEHLMYERKLLEFKISLEKWLGESTSGGEFNYAFTPRDKGGQYARSDLIVTIRELPKDEDMIPKVLQSMLHEISHFWWNKTSTSEYNNWLDEALAEYSSSLVISVKYGGDAWLEERAKKILEILIKAGSLPAIRAITRAHKDAYTVFYYRGFLLLRELHKSMKTEQFKSLLSEFATKCNKSATITTDDFLEMLSKYKDPENDLTSLVNNWLDFEGEGIPQ